MGALRLFTAVQRALALIFLALCLALAELTLSGKYTTAGNWTPASKPVITSEVKVPAGKKLEITTESNCRAIISEGEVTGTSTLNVGDATAPTEAAFKEIAFKLTVGSVWSHTGKLVFKGSSATVLQIWSGGHTLNNESVTFTAAGKWKLEEDTSCGSSTSFEVSGKGTLETNGKKLEAGKVAVKEAGTTGNITGSTIRCTSPGGTAWECSEAATLTSTGSTVEVPDTGTNEKRFLGGGKAYATATIPGNFVVIEGANSYTTFNANNKAKPGEAKGTVTALSNHLVVTSGEAALSVGAEVSLTGVPIGTTLIKKIEAGLWEMSANATETVVVAELVTVYAVGVLFQKGVIQTFATAPTFNGTEAEPNRVASTEAGKQATWKLSAGNHKTTAKVRVKDLAVEAGADYYFPNGVDLGGNNTHVHFTEEPSAGVEIPVQSAGATSSASMGLNAPTQIPVAAAVANSAALLALNAPTAIPVSAAVAASSASLALNAPTRIPVTAAEANSATLLALHAPTQVPVSAASAASATQLTLGAPVPIPVSPAAASSAGQLALNAPTRVVPQSAEAASSASLSLSALTRIPTEPAGAASSTSLTLGLVTQVPLQSASASTSASLNLNAATQIPVSPATCSSSGALSLSTTPHGVELPLQSASSSSSTQLTLSVPVSLVLSSSTSTSSTEFTLSVQESSLAVFAVVRVPGRMPAVVHTPAQLNVRVRSTEP